MAALFLLLFAWNAQAADVVLAVVDFDVSSAREDVQPLGRGITNMLVTDVGAASEVKVVERNRIQDVLDDVDQTALVLVTLPDTLPVNEALDLLESLGERKHQVQAIVAYGEAGG